MVKDTDLSIQDTDEDYIKKTVPKGVEFQPLNELPESESNLILYTGVSYLGGAFIGSQVGFTKGILHAISLPEKAKFKNRVGAFLDTTGSTTGRVATNLAAGVFLFGCLKKLLSGTGIQEESIMSSTIAGATIGVLHRAPKGPIHIGIGGVIGATIGYILSLNSRHIKRQ
ncbi:hypothetical protein DLAC_01430 [Tieghemostelium lacteum]|uniref:Uncharacterized protein n=1 Tax=Tieghemostelium lacteum TaxID=361077 RepID=A0A152A5E7_TIELA|nr:hypothetical protein DLAC_01430 [Tieghemostelium lacteum]|eukprot:KYR01449.1 hypothetical protein DLAC_01430 [Tieghemostelium lacteum]